MLADFPALPARTGAAAQEALLGQLGRRVVRGDGPGADCLCAAGPGAHDLVVLVTNGVAGRRVEGVILHKMILMIVVLLDGVLIL